VQKLSAESVFVCKNNGGLLGLSLAETIAHSLQRGKGCTSCFHSGCLGREAVIERLNIDDAVRSILYEEIVIGLRHYLRKIQLYFFSGGDREGAKRYYHS
jgi:type II secretory ATPase GspE/PulE/Tfp pilus assembly ATPase PilB-like protein